jgi:phosphoglycolate phosphatase
MQQAANAVMVGDTHYDMEMARNAAMPRVAVSYGAHPLDRLRVYEPIACIDRFEQMIALFDGTLTAPT